MYTLDNGITNSIVTKYHQLNPNIIDINMIIRDTHNVPSTSTHFMPVPSVIINLLKFTNDSLL